MRVVVWGINYAPEVAGIAPHNVALCEFLAKKDVDVEMVTTFAYYPMWKKSAQDRHRLFRTDVINDVWVYRCWHFVPARVSAWKRIIHEATFVLTSTLRALTLPRPDVYVVVSPPLLLGMAAWFVTLFKRAPIVFLVKDLQPDAAIGLGMVRAGWFTRALYWLEAFAYKHATMVGGLSNEMLEAFRRKGVPDKKILLFPDGVVVPDELPARGNFRARHRMTDADFLAVYSGNLGVKQGLKILIDAAEHLRDQPNIRIVICGDGAARASLERSMQDRHLQNVTMLPLQSDRGYKELLVDADISLITQQSGSGNAFFPSKILMTLAHGCPVVTVADEESALAKAVRDGNCGTNVLPGDAAKLAQTFRDLAQDRPASAKATAGRQSLREWGKNGRAYVARYDRGKLLADFFAKLKSLGHDDACPSNQ
ncbi:MAG: colanic acid biosynthesis glycosyl transferase WcaI [Verrucomicrobiota bacterium]